MEVKVLGVWNKLHKTKTVNPDPSSKMKFCGINFFFNFLILIKQKKPNYIKPAI